MKARLGVLTDITISFLVIVGAVSYVFTNGWQ